MVRLVRPHGRIVLKSREHRPVHVCLRDLLPKEPVIEAVHYGNFATAVRLLADGTLRIDDLIGPCYPLKNYRQALDEASRAETSKVFLLPGDD
jgi:L-iditol 2-dehydrogenase